MKWFAVILMLLPLAGGAEYELWILAGQSNAQGWKGDACHYPPGGEETDRSVPFYYASPGIGTSGGRWIGLAPQQGRFKRGYFGPEITFARTLADRGRRPAVFKFTLGGTSLDRRWKGPGEGGLYDDMLRELDRARRAFRRNGHTLRVAGFIWIQGESDAVDPGASIRYAANLERLIRHLRAEIAPHSRLPVILGIDEQHPVVVRRPVVLSAQQQLAGRDPAIRFVGMTGLPKADKSHLTPKGLATHGRRLAAAALTLSR